MTRGENLPDVSTAETRSKGGHARGEKLRADRAEARQAYLEHLASLTSGALERLAELLESEDEQVAIRAAVAILDRVLGRPPQRVETALAEPITVRLAFDPRSPN